MQIKTFVFNPFYENTYVIYDETNDAIIIDPGCYEKYEIEELSSFIEENNLQVKTIINTHCHIDHVLGNQVIKERYGVPLQIPVGEVEILRSVEVYATHWGIMNYVGADYDSLIAEEQIITVGNQAFQTLLVPGHSPGHICLYAKSENVLIGGDVLFRESIGRTDLPGGNHEELLDNIQSKVYSLPDETTVYPGHGDTTTIGYEKQHNPFVRA
ncbi:MAG: MBL fold metallo-hydrolase [Cyclobacteriaceae bacterium]|nr:MBL fold metallo-hydrolase [Cyclobacteriaceae bacterium HetDA_MAG_MS6]